MGATATRRDVIVIGLIGLVIGALLTAILVATTPAGAATGDNAKLGLWNRAGKQTVFTAGAGATVMIRNTKAGKIPLDLQAPAGAPPMRVDSSIKVDNLNADYLDGLSAESIQPLWWGCSDPGDPDDWDCPVTRSFPTNGDLLVTGSVEVLADAGYADRVTCGFYVDGVWQPHSEFRLDVGAGDFGVCASTLWAEGMTTGEHTVNFTVLGVAESTDVYRGTFWMVFFPEGAKLP